MNIHGLLGVQSNIDDEELKKVFRKKTLDCNDDVLIQTIMNAYEEFEKNNVGVGVSVGPISMGGIGTIGKMNTNMMTNMMTNMTPNISNGIYSVQGNISNTNDKPNINFDDNFKKYEGMIKMVGNMMGIDIEKEIQEFGNEFAKNYMEHQEYTAYNTNFSKRKNNSNKNKSTIEILNDCDDIIDEIVQPEKKVLIYDVCVSKIYEGFNLSDIDNNLDFDNIYIEPGKTEMIINKDNCEYTIKFQPTAYENFNYVDNVLYYNKYISLKEALCGFSFTLKHLNKNEYVLKNFNKVITPGHEIRLNNLGMKKGQLVIKFHINFPETLNEDQREKLNNIL